MRSTGVFVFLLFVWLSSAQKPPFRIVHLGDSFSAGNGARRADGSRNYHSVSGCFRSLSNWGSRFAASLEDVFSVTYINRACSGAVIDNIINERELDSSPVDMNCPDAEFPDEESIRASDGMCTRFLRPQIEAIDMTVDLVILTIGGNDVRFSEIVRECFFIGIRSPDSCREAVEFATATFGGLGGRLENLFAAIRGRLRPEARIALISYPHLLLDVPYVLGFTDDFDAGNAIRQLSIQGDEVQRAAVAAANAAAGVDFVVFFDRSKELFDTHEPDPSVLRSNPIRWLNEFDGLTQAEWYHPNAEGHENWGAAISVLDTFGSVGGGFEGGGNVDLAFVVDTTGSMSGEIAEIRTNLNALVDQLSTATNSFRVAVVSYRDFPERAGPGNFPSRVDQTFTNNLGAIRAGIESLEATGGGDFPESVLSGIKEAIDLPWRVGVTKVAVVIGDAPALIESGAEPISGLTSAQVVSASIAVDPVQVVAVDVGSLLSPELSNIVEETGGAIIDGSANLTAAITDTIGQSAVQPFAWFGTSLAGRIGEPTIFNAQGSFDPRGNPINSYEWDFDGDGTFDETTTEETIEFTYTTAFAGFVVLRVTSVGGSSLASARVVINEEGSVSQGGETPCELDENGVSIFITEAGIINGSCTADNLPTEDIPGVIEITADGGPEGEDGDELASALNALDSAVEGLPPVFEAVVQKIRQEVENGEVTSACQMLARLEKLARNRHRRFLRRFVFKLIRERFGPNFRRRLGKRLSAIVADFIERFSPRFITNSQSMNVIAAVDNIQNLLDCSA